MKEINDNRHVVIISHGTWIQYLLGYLIEDLKFPVLCESISGYPKNTGIYRIQIQKVQVKENEFEWKGEITMLNEVFLLFIEGFSFGKD